MIGFGDVLPSFSPSFFLLDGKKQAEKATNLSLTSSCDGQALAVWSHSQSPQQPQPPTGLEKHTQKRQKKTTTGARKPRRGRNTNEHQVTKKRGRTPPPSAAASLFVWISQPRRGDRRRRLDNRTPAPQIALARQDQAGPLPCRCPQITAHHAATSLPRPILGAATFRDSLGWAWVREACWACCCGSGGWRLKLRWDGGSKVTGDGETAHQDRC